jgi:hypothetical protein
MFQRAQRPKTLSSTGLKKSHPEAWKTAPASRVALVCGSRDLCAALFRSYARHHLVAFARLQSYELALALS